MTSRKNVDDFIKGWNWDEESHEYARQLGTFLLQFLDSLEATGLSAQTLKKHRDNCWCIGLLHCSYWFRGVFSPSMFLYAPSYVDEFKRKMSDSGYAVASYQATWRKLGRYVRSQN